MCFTKEKRCYCPQCSKTIAKTVTDCICPSNEQCLTRNIRPLPVQKKEVPSDQSCRDCASGHGGASSSSRSRSSSSSSTAGRHPSEIGGSGGGRYISPPGMSGTSNRIQTLNSDYQPRQSGSSSRQQQQQGRSGSSRQGEYRSSSSSSSSSSRRADAGAGAEGSARFNGSSSRNGGGSSVDVGFERRPAFDLIERRPGGSSGSTARQGEYVGVSGSGSGSGSGFGSRSSSSSSSTARQSHSGSSSSSSSSRQGGDRYGQLVERRPSASSRSSSSRYGGDGTGDEHSYPSSSSSSRSRRNAVDYGVNGSVTYTSRTVEVSITYH
ncbi:hypothetical protein LTR47_005596 [Exophiala xenobiotica]|nr:hypothetical protein LTR47_005596 [Exophiala xenobiotica]KAK5245201.1 hypothetical protein LTS06_009344 [Exophiala xenobiotica]KAK5349197.1 hypothetical protein LTR61_007235 [Exophiala xenobiotica]KAK5365324.1 hypothetical protein LTR11_008734 [Exophiala xenobiotica]KAK5372851.1 hypothetical protein LTS03_006539 [Exophiala xenobiotica]